MSRFNAYRSPGDAIGMAESYVVHARAFAGYGVGFWKVFPVVGGFYFRSALAVMDDFGNLVSVEA